MLASLSKIFIYPIKALSGVAVDQVAITAGGSLEGDRRWAMFGKNGKPINGKNNHKVFSLKAHFNLENETVSFLDKVAGPQLFDLNDQGRLEQYLGDYLRCEVRLGENKAKGFPDDPTAGGPTVVSEASLRAVLSWFPELDMDEIRARFRINVEVSGVSSFWEDAFFRSGKPPKAAKVGDVLIEAVNPCARCSVPTKSSTNGQRYSRFHEIFVAQREAHQASWTDPACFDHWYRLSINTNINSSEAGKVITMNDTVSII